MLDELVRDKPMLVYAHDLHTAWANTRALQMAERLYPMPPYPPLAEELDLQDQIVLGPDALPSGEFREPEACCLVSGPLEAAFTQPLETQLDDLEAVCRTLAAKGITGVHRMALAQPAEDIAFLLLLLEREQRGRLPIRVCTSFSAPFRPASATWCTAPISAATSSGAIRIITNACPGIPARVIASMQPLHERPPVTLWHRLVPQPAWNTPAASRVPSNRECWPIWLFSPATWMPCSTILPRSTSAAPSVTAVSSATPPTNDR
jgi:predicted amidohydrolase YtcJ